MKKIICKYIYSWLFVIISMLAAFEIVESYNGNIIFTMDKSIFVLNMFLYGAVWVLIYMISGHIKAASIGLLLISGVFGFVNYYVRQFRGNPLLAADIFSISTAAEVAGHYSIELTAETVAIAAVTIVLIVITALLKLNKRLSGLKRIYEAFLGVLFIAFVGWLYFFSGKCEKWGMSTLDVNMQEVYLRYGSAVAYTLTAKNLIEPVPEGYKEGAVREIAERYETDAPENAGVNVIAIINETFCDPELFVDIPTNKDPLPFIHSLKENVITGTLYSSIYGGNTANSEYEFMTGNTEAFLPIGSVTFQGLKNEMPSIVRDMRRNGYVGLNGYHPGERRSWNRAQAYSLMGFNEFYSLESFQNAEYERGFATDASMYVKVLADFDELLKEEAPAFIYGITIQNHGGYEEWGEVSKDIEITDSEFKDKELELYLNLIHETDAAFEKMIHHLEKIDEPVVLIFFGDHQPRFSEAMCNKLTNGVDANRYKAPFYIWANYDIKEENIDMISMNYLSAKVQELIGNGLSGYNKFLLDLNKEIPVITSQGYMTSDGEHYILDQKETPAYDRLSQYRYLQYYNMHESSNSLKGFFGLDVN